MTGDPVAAHHPPEAGKSSYDLCDLSALWASLPLRGATKVLDAGCGRGLYTLAIASRLDPGAKIVGVDLWQQGVEELSRSARRQGTGNVESVRADLAHLPFLESGSVDLVFGATVLHDLVARGAHAAVLGELSRVLREGGRMAWIEFHKRSSHPGPPEEVRLAPEHLREIVRLHGPEEADVRYLGEHLYLSVFRK
jgi:ubiquinone/menaquinone biosynthesis C-methylase UbiE